MLATNDGILLRSKETGTGCVRPSRVNASRALTIIYCRSVFSPSSPPSLTMLPRHVRRIVLTSSTPQRIRTALTATATRPTLAQQRLTVIHSSSFHSSTRRQNDGPPKSPFQTFVDVLREELRKNRELQDNVKQLQGDVDKLQDSEAMKKARAAYERARVSFCKGIRAVYVKEAHEIA